MIPAAATLAFPPMLSFHPSVNMTGTICSPVTDLESYYLGAPAITAAGLNGGSPSCASESGCESESPHPKTAAEKEIAEAQVKSASYNLQTFSFLDSSIKEKKYFNKKYTRYRKVHLEMNCKSWIEQYC